MARLVAERRDLVARAARDRLANMLGVHPRDLSSLDATVATAMTDHLNRVNRRIQQLVDQTAVDEVTGALRRAAGLDALEREVRRARRFADQRLVVTFIDVDGLKEVNDTQGHTAGDALLKELAGCLHDRLRAYDLVVRWGGDEFICALPEAGLRSAGKVMDQVASMFAARTGASFSVGLAEIREGEAGQDLVTRADSALLDRRAQSPAPALGPVRRPQRRTGAVLAAAALALLLGSIALDLALATPGTLWWLPHALADTGQVQMARSPAQAELELARARTETAAAKAPGPARRAWLANASLHLAEARANGANPAGVQAVQLLINNLQN